MGVRHEPETFVHQCDLCGLEVRSSSRSRPSDWIGLMVDAAALDYQGAAVADAGFSRSFCRPCGERLLSLLRDQL